jgi:hypothetical protein
MKKEDHVARTVCQHGLTKEKGHIGLTVMFDYNRCRLVDKSGRFSGPERGPARMLSTAKAAVGLNNQVIKCLGMFMIDRVYAERIYTWKMCTQKAAVYKPGWQMMEGRKVCKGQWKAGGRRDIYT